MSCVRFNDNFFLFLLCLVFSTLRCSVHSQQEFSPRQNYDEDDRTLLDIFGESAKQYLTQKVIPPTDVECRWDWRSVRCEPYCHCDFLPQWGDYHLGRSCRLVSSRLNQEQQGDNSSCEDIPPNSMQWIIQRMIEGSRKLITTTENTAKSGYSKIQTHICDGMPEVRCLTSGELPLIAWQERLFCPHKIPKCEPPPPSSSSDWMYEQVITYDLERLGGIHTDSE